MAKNRKLNVDEVLEVWDEIPDYTCETDESSEDEYIPSDHDHVELTDMEFADENEGGIVETNNAVQADCAATPESSTSSNKGLKNNSGRENKGKVLAQRKRLLLVK